MKELKQPLSPVCYKAKASYGQNEYSPGSQQTLKGGLRLNF